MTKYPADEFDEVSISVDRQGVHRERLMPERSSGLALKIVVGVLALLVGLAAYFLLPRLGLENAGPNNDAAAGTASVDGAAPSASGDPGLGSDSADAAADSPTPVPQDQGPEGVPSAAVDQTQAVNVLNATGTAGLATTAVGRLTAEGWTGAIAGNWPGQPVQASTVFHSGADQQSAARELAGALGIDAVVMDPEVGPLLTAVLGPDFQ
ncbi:LytR C-terminal domain-containing protein [Arthrobacter sp. H41]|uniref:LytR C-terminal domain-containing protein n=1 Tax=Arthrobacter sp. H41 TaxID=1312978 RepID=UPI00047CBF34|nr:LytR C-terminal domain-containing protein [Arthrobacter sp. H41]